MDLVALADFNLVAVHGGFGRASRASGRSKATLSRRVMELENELGVRLVERGAHVLRLTEDGRTLRARTEGLLAELADVGETIGAGLDRPRGVLRVSAPILFSHLALARIAAQFSRTYPDVRLDVTAEDKLSDPVEDEYDVVIRVNPKPDDRLIGRCFLRDERRLVASPDMIRPVPIAGEALRIAAVTMTSMPEGAIWRVVDAHGRTSIRPEPVLRFSSILMIRDAVLAGGGAALLPLSVVAEDLKAGRLVDWGTDEDGAVELWALHTSRRLASSKVTTFMRYLVDTFHNESLRLGG
jgi:DNA-binding transcriptional LysR family regulator